MAVTDPIKDRGGALERLDRSGLRSAWSAAFGKPPPGYLSMPFMRKALLHDAQCRRFGGLSAEVKRALKAAEQGRDGGVATAAPPVLTPGSQLVREWNGRTHVVEVTGDGYLMDGIRYRSLSAVARRITGARWSGPRFFGLTSRRAA